MPNDPVGEMMQQPAHVISRLLHRAVGDPQHPGRVGMLGLRTADVTVLRRSRSCSRRVRSCSSAAADAGRTEVSHSACDRRVSQAQRCVTSCSDTFGFAYATTLAAAPMVADHRSP